MTSTERAADPSRPPWLGRATAYFFLGLGAFVVAGWMLLKLRTLLVMLLVSLVASFAIEPAVNRLERLGVRRGLGTLLTFLAALVVGAGFIFLMGRLAAEQAADLIEQAPEYLTSTQDWLNETFDLNVEFDDLVAEFNEGGQLGGLAADVAPDIVAVGARLVGLLFQLLTVMLFTFYLVADGPRLRRTLCSAFPPERQREILRVWELGIAKTGGYIYSRALLALASFLFHWAAFRLIGVPSPLVLAMWVGFVSQFVPVVGTYIAGALPIAIGTADQPVNGLWVLLVVIVYQQIENYLLAPRVTAHTMDIHPAIAFGSVIAGAAVLGPVGALLALPLAATGTALASSMVVRHEVVESRLTRPTRHRRWQRRVVRTTAPGPAEEAETVEVEAEVATVDHDGGEVPDTVHLEARVVETEEDGSSTIPCLDVEEDADPHPVRPDVRPDHPEGRASQP
ncbi:MAG: AI-2E family transporter [Acidimicrobiia bacterium]|nr:AI-2E family transporter [Acidimicrobiia bacterium]